MDECENSRQMDTAIQKLNDVYEKEVVPKFRSFDDRPRFTASDSISFNVSYSDASSTCDTPSTGV